MPRHYKQFIQRQNMFSDNAFPENIKELTQTHIDEIKDTLACNMSPENLHCDGEATRMEVEAKVEHYEMLCREISVNTRFHLSLAELEY